MEIGSLWIKLGLGANDFRRGLRDSERDARSFGNSLSNTLRTAANSAQASLRSLSRVRIGEVMRMPEFRSTINELRDLQLNYQLTVSRMGQSATETQKLEAQLNHLNQVLEVHQRGMGAVRAAYERSVAEKGEDAAETRRLAAELRRLEVAENGLRNQIETTDNALRQQREDTRSANSAMRRLGSSMRAAVPSAKVLVGVLAAGGAALAGIGAKSVVAAAQMETVQIAFTTMLGSAEKATALMKDLQKFGAETPFEFPEIQKSAKSLLAFGVEAGNMKDTLRAIGDIASGVGAPLDELAEIYGKARVQGRLFAEDINQLTGRGIPIIGELAKQFGVSEGEVSKLVESGQVGFSQLEEAFKSLTGEGGRFHDMMKAQSETLPGMWSNLMDSIGQGAVVIGQELIKAFDLKDKLQAFIDAFGRVSNLLQEKGLKGALAELFPPGLQATIAAITGAITGPLIIALGSLTAALWGALAPILPIMAAGAAIGALAYVIIRNWEPIKAFFQNLWKDVNYATVSTWNSIKNAISTAVNEIISTILGHLSRAKDFIKNIFSIDFNIGDIVAGLENLRDLVWQHIAYVGNDLLSGISKWGNAFLQWFSFIPGEIKNKFAEWENAFSQWFSSLANNIPAWLINVKTNLVSGIGNWTTVFVEWIKNLPEKMHSGWNNFIASFMSRADKTESVGQKISNNIVSGATTTLKSKNTLLRIAEALAGIAIGLPILLASGFISFGWKLVAFIVAGIVERIPELSLIAVEGIKKALSIIANIAKDAYSWGKNIIQGLVDGISSMFNQVKETIGNVVAGIKNRVKNLLGIASPSKAMEEFGVAISEGLAKGIEGAGKEPVNEAALMAQAVIDAVGQVTGNRSLGIQVEQAKFDLLQAKLGETGDESLSLQAKIAMLTEQLSLQGDIVTVVQAAYEKMAAVKGETAQETQELQLRLLQEQKTQAELGTQLKQTNSAFAGQQDKLESLNQQMQISNLLYDIAQAQLGQNATENEKLTLQHSNLTKQLSIQNQIAAELNREYAQSVSEKGRDAKATQELYVKLLDAQKAQADFTAKLRDTNTAIAEQSKKLEEQKAKVSEVADKYRQDMANALNDYQNKVAQANQKLADDERKLTADYQNAVSQRARSLQDWVSLFDAVPKKKDVTGEQLLGNLQEQVGAFKSWQENLKELTARGVDEGLIAELGQMGPKASGEIAALLTLTDDELSQYALLWQEKNSLARQQAAEELSGLQAETQAKIEELRANTATQLEQYRQEWEKKNQEIRDNTAKTLQGMVDEATKQGTAFVQALADAISTALPGLSTVLTGLPGAPATGAADQAGQAADQKKVVIGEAQDQANQHAAIVQNEMAVLLQAWTDAGSKLSSNQNEIKTQTLATWQEIQQRLLTLWQKINADLKKGWTDNRSFIFDTLKQVDDRFKATESAATAWGRNLMGNFISGIQSMRDELDKTLLAISMQVEAYIGFHSPTKLGPGREADTWAPNLVKMFTSGILGGIPSIRKAVHQIAVVMADIAGIDPVITTKIEESNTKPKIIDSGAINSKTEQPEAIKLEAEKPAIPDLPDAQYKAALEVERTDSTTQDIETQTASIEVLTPTVDVPSISPDIELQSAQVEVLTPEPITPEVKTPEPITPEVKTPGPIIPEAQAPEPIAPEVRPPEPIKAIQPDIETIRLQDDLATIFKAATTIFTNSISNIKPFLPVQPGSDEALKISPIAKEIENELSKIKAMPQMLLETLRAPSVDMAAPSVAAVGGGDIFNISITGSNAEEIWNQLERKLHRYGVRW